LDGLVLFAAYATKTLPDNLCAVSVYGSEDKVLNMEKVESSRAFMPSDYTEYCIALADEFRNAGIACETEYTGRSMKAQFKFADKQKAEYVIVLGGSEIESGECEVKKQSDGTREKVRISDLISYFQNK
jgi:histidyl-tRNA synthetase